MESNNPPDRYCIVNHPFQCRSHLVHKSGTQKTLHLLHCVKFPFYGVSKEFTPNQGVAEWVEDNERELYFFKRYFRKMIPGLKNWDVASLNTMRIFLGLQ